MNNKKEVDVGRVDSEGAAMVEVVWVVVAGGGKTSKILNFFISILVFVMNYTWE